MTGWLDVMKLDHPRNLVVAEDVKEGKPGTSTRPVNKRLSQKQLMNEDPECYQLGREKLGLSADSRVLVVEDSPAGIRAGKAASCSVVGLATTHSIAQLRDNGPDWIVKDLQSVRFVSEEADKGEVTIEISNSLE